MRYEVNDCEKIGRRFNMNTAVFIVLAIFSAAVGGAIGAFMACALYLAKKGEEDNG